MAINPAGTGSASLAAQITSSLNSQVETEKDAVLLKKALSIEEETMAGILESLGIGQNVDVIV